MRWRIRRLRLRSCRKHCVSTPGITSAEHARDGILDIPRFVGIKDSCVQDTVQVERDIVGGNGALAGDLDGDLLERLDVGNAVDKGHQDGKTRLEDAVELAHALDDPGSLLRDEADDGVGGEGWFLEVGGGQARPAWARYA